MKTLDSYLARRKIGDRIYFGLTQTDVNFESKFSNLCQSSLNQYV